jgi:hypothetical protein
MKSQASVLLAVAVALLEDLQLAYPSIPGIELDIRRLALGSQARGLGFFSLDLPALDSILTDGLENGRLNAMGPLTQRISKRCKLPRFLGGIWQRVFDNDACLRKDVDVDCIAFLRQIFCLGKKVQIMCSPQRLQIALKEYHDVERTTRPATLKWELDELDPLESGRSLQFIDCLPPETDCISDEHRSSTKYDRILLTRCQRVADLLSDALGPFEPTSYSRDVEENGRGIGFKHGPGAVARPDLSRTKYEFKYWPAKLEAVFPYRECGTHISDTVTSPQNHEVPARLLAVPKTAKSPRLIAAEPVEHQWCQQIIRHFLVERLRENFGVSFIAFHRQDLSGSMALQGSLDNSLATIDLSSASDRLSCWTVERLFRRNPLLLTSLHSCRTRWIRDELSDTPSFLKLRKFASQGTAVTFPVQSILFLCVALAASADRFTSLRDFDRLRSRVRVFGDDIIVPKDRYADTTRLLELLGLKVNVNKSFHIGDFRESCGTDGYRGYDVTPVKPVRVEPDGSTSRQAVLDSANNFFTKGYWKASDVLLSTLPKSMLRRLRIVGRESGLTGVTSFCGSSDVHLRRRWNRNYQRDEVWAWGLNARCPRKYTGERTALLQYFTEDPRCQPGWRHGVAGRPTASDGGRWEPSLS